MALQTKRKDKMTKTAIIYARQSAGDDEFSESVELQISKLKELARKEGIEVKGIFHDLNTSGRTYPTGAEELAKMDLQYESWFRQQTKTKKFREGLGKVLEAVGKGKIDYVLVYDLTRLYRPVTGSFLESYIAQKLDGVRVKTLSGEIDLGSFSDGLVSSLTNRINDDQLARTKKKSIEAMRSLKARGYRVCGKAPFGYFYDKNTKSLRVKQDEIELVRMAFRMVLERSKSYAGISRELNMLGKRIWCVNTLAKTLKNPVYCGMMTNPEGQLIDLQKGQIDKTAITKAEWYKVQNMMTPKKSKCGWKSKKYNYALAGLIFCGYCGHPMAINTAPGWSGVGRHDGPLTSRAYCHRKTYGKCKGIIRYSGLAPIPIGTKPKYDVFKPNGLAGRGQRTYATRGDDEPEKMKVDGLAEGVMPILAGVCLEIVGRKDDSSTAEKIESLKMDLSNMEARKKSFLDLLKSGLVSFEEVKMNLEEIKAKTNEIKAETSRLEAEKSTTSEEQKQKAYAMLEAIQKGTLHPSDFRELFLLKFQKINVFDDRVELVRIDGGKINLPRANYCNIHGMPPHVLRVKEYKDGSVKAVVRYYLNNHFTKSKNDDEKVVFRSQNLEILAIS